jgi:4-aminobutyrate aminotransferase
MIGVQVATNQIRDAAIDACFRRGLLVLGAGPTTIRLSPPLIIDEAQADTAADILDSALPA